MMLKQNKIIIGLGSFLLVLLLTGCAKKLYEQRLDSTGQTSSVIHTTATDSGETHTVTDTLRTIDAPVESSRNQVTDSSYLTTSLAWSSAVCREGRLDHRIGNQPKIDVPVRVEYRDRWHTVHDTVSIRDTLRKTETLTVKKESTPLGLRIWAGIGKGILVAGAIWLVWNKLIRKWK